MKLNSKTLSILKNFSTINQSILVRPGNVLSTISPAKTVAASATLDEDQVFPQEFAIYDLSRFMGVLSLFNEPELEFGDDRFVVIRQGRQVVKYVFVEPTMIVAHPAKRMALPSSDYKFSLTVDQLARLQKALSVLQMNEIAIRGSDGVISIETFDSKGAVSDTFSFEVGETDDEFTAVIRSENLKLISANYQVSISKQKLVRFAAITDDNLDLQYWTALEASSNIG